MAENYEVALVRISDDYGPEVAVRGTGVFDSKWYVGGPRLGSQHGWYENRIEIVRRLVVIDPEDREQVERLNDTIGAVGYRDDFADRLQATLREFANPTPPKPEEPQGLGAVVEDAEGVLWIRVNVECNLPRPWAAQGNVGGNMIGWRTYADITAVRVLSEGVTP